LAADVRIDRSHTHPHGEDHGRLRGLERQRRADRQIRDFYKWEQNFLEDCLRRGVIYALPARGDERIALDIESLCAIVGRSALATRASTP
jgi:hypothetical protein